MPSTYDFKERLERLEADLKERGRRAVKFSRQTLLAACFIGEVGLILAIAAAYWNAGAPPSTYQAWQPSISDMASDWMNPEGRIFFGTIVAMGVVLLSSRYAEQLLLVESVWEQTLLDVLVPVGIIVLACVPTRLHPAHGFILMSAVHSISAGIVFVCAPIVLLIKSIPRRRTEGFFNRHGFWRANDVLSRSKDVMIHFGCCTLNYRWWMMAVVQVITLGFFVTFFVFNSYYAGSRSPELARYHVVSFVAEFLCISSLFVSFLIIARIGKQATKKRKEEQPGSGSARRRTDTREQRGRGEVYEEEGAEDAKDEAQEEGRAKPPFPSVVVTV